MPHTVRSLSVRIQAGVKTSLWGGGGGRMSHYLPCYNSCPCRQDLKLNLNYSRCASPWDEHCQMHQACLCSCVLVGSTISIITIHPIWSIVFRNIQSAGSLYSIEYVLAFHVHCVTLSLLNSTVVHTQALSGFTRSVFI